MYALYTQLSKDVGELITREMLGFERSSIECIFCSLFEYNFIMFNFHQGYEHTAMTVK